MSWIIVLIDFRYWSVGLISPNIDCSIRYMDVINAYIAMGMTNLISYKCLINAFCFLHHAFLQPCASNTHHIHTIIRFALFYKFKSNSWFANVVYNKCQHWRIWSPKKWCSSRFSTFNKLSLRYQWTSLHQLQFTSRKLNLNLYLTFKPTWSFTGHMYTLDKCVYCKFSVLEWYMGNSLWNQSGDRLQWISNK